MSLEFLSRLNISICTTPKTYHSSLACLPHIRGKREEEEMVYGREEDG